MDQYIIETVEYFDEKKDEGLVLWTCHIRKVVEIVSPTEEFESILVVCENDRYLHRLRDCDLFLSGDSRIHGCEYSTREIYDKVGRYFTCLDEPESVSVDSTFVLAIHRDSETHEANGRLHFQWQVRDIFVTDLDGAELLEAYCKTSQENCLADFAFLENAIDNTQNKIARLRNRNISEEEETKILEGLIEEGRAKNGLKKENIADNMRGQHD